MNNDPQQNVLLPYTKYLRFRFTTNCCKYSIFLYGTLFWFFGKLGHVVDKQCVKGYEMGF